MLSAKPGIHAACARGREGQDEANRHWVADAQRHQPRHKKPTFRKPLLIIYQLTRRLGFGGVLRASPVLCTCASVIDKGTCGLARAGRDRSKTPRSDADAEGPATPPGRPPHARRLVVAVALAALRPALARAHRRHRSAARRRSICCGCPDRLERRLWRRQRWSCRRHRRAGTGFRRHRCKRRRLPHLRGRARRRSPTQPRGDSRRSPASPAAPRCCSSMPAQARARLMANPWIAEATVLKLYPGPPADRASPSARPSRCGRRTAASRVIAADGTVLEPFVPAALRRAAAGGRQRRRARGAAISSRCSTAIPTIARPGARPRCWSPSGAGTCG